MMDYVIDRFFQFFENMSEAARHESLKRLVYPPGQWLSFMRESGKPVHNGIALFKTKTGSYRWVKYVNGVGVAGLQVMSDDKGKTGVVANVYTDPKYRRQGHATELVIAASKVIGKLMPSEDQSESGAKFGRSFGESEEYQGWRRWLETLLSQVSDTE